MDPWDILVWLGSAGFILCLMPQLVHTLRRRSAEDLSLAFLLLVLASSAVTMTYMLHQSEYVFAASQMANLVVWSTVLYFRLRPGKSRSAKSSRS